MSFFFKKKKEPVVDVNTTIANMREHIETLEKREEYITNKITLVLKEAAMKNSKGNKQGALFCLKKKKMYEQEIEKLQGARVAMEKQIIALEGANTNVSTMKMLQQGGKTMQAVRGNIEADDVDQLMDAIREEQDMADQIADAISRPGQEMFDDDELLEELAGLSAEQLDQELAAVPSAPTAQKQPAVSLPSMPSAPTSAPVQQTAAMDEEEQALLELQRQMMLA